MIGLVSTLVIDAANVVGSRPDGWWRDRAGAAQRLYVAVAAAHAAARLDHHTVVMVLEGQARAGPAEGARRGIQVVHAAGSGDDEIVAQAVAAAEEGAVVTVVTADRDLRARLPEGVQPVGSRWLLERLGPTSPG